MKAHDRERRDGRREGREKRRGGGEGGAQQHERPTAECIDQGPDERLAENAHRVVEAHHEADLDLAPAGALDVERQENEAVETEEEEKVGDRRPDESLVG